METLAIDPGYGNMKVAWRGQAKHLQSAVSVPVTVGLAATGMTMRENGAVRVTTDGREWVCGAGAWTLGRATSNNMDFSGVVSPERMALIYAAAHDLMPQDAGVCAAIIGLPVPLMQDEAMMTAIKKSLVAFKRRHEYQVAGITHGFEINAVKILAQPVGAYWDYVYEWDGNELLQRDGATRQDVAVLDLGMNTLDVIVVEKNKIRPGFIGGGKTGVRRLLDMARIDGYDIAERDYMLRHGEINISEHQLETWLGDVMTIVEDTLRSLRRFDRVIVTGGGAMHLGERLRDMLAASGAALHWPEDLLTANVKGLWKYAHYQNTTTRKSKVETGA